MKFRYHKINQTFRHLKKTLVAKSKLHMLKSCPILIIKLMCTMACFYFDVRKIRQSEVMFIEPPGQDLGGSQVLHLLHVHVLDFHTFLRSMLKKFL